ncbi:hypothetical protein, partial [Leifsonia sp. SIMBA_070]
SEAAAIRTLLEKQWLAGGNTVEDNGAGGSSAPESGDDSTEHSTNRPTKPGASAVDSEAAQEKETGKDS